MLIAWISLIWIAATLGMIHTNVHYKGLASPLQTVWRCKASVRSTLTGRWFSTIRPVAKSFGFLSRLSREDLCRWNLFSVFMKLNCETHTDKILGMFAPHVGCWEYAIDFSVWGVHNTYHSHSVSALFSNYWTLYRSLTDWWSFHRLHVSSTPIFYMIIPKGNTRPQPQSFRKSLVPEKY